MECKVRLIHIAQQSTLMKIMSQQLKYISFLPTWIVFAPIQVQLNVIINSTTISQLVNCTKIKEKGVGYWIYH